MISFLIPDLNIELSKTNSIRVSASFKNPWLYSLVQAKMVYLIYPVFLIAK